MVENCSCLVSVSLHVSFRNDLCPILCVLTSLSHQFFPILPGSVTFTMHFIALGVATVSLPQQARIPTNNVGQLLIVSILVVQKECPHSLKQKFISTPGTLSACPQLPEAFHLSCRSRIVPDSSAPHLWTIRWRRSCHPIQCHPTVARTAHPSIILHTCCCRRRSRGSASHRHRRSGVSKTTEVVE